MKLYPNFGPCHLHRVSAISRSYRPAGNRVLINAPVTLLFCLDILITYVQSSQYQSFPVSRRCAAFGKLIRLVCGFGEYVWSDSACCLFTFLLVFFFFFFVRVLVFPCDKMADNKTPSLVEASKPVGHENGVLERTRSLTKDENGNTVITDEDGETFVIDQKAERALLWKFDLRILPLL